jgi:hypothetical protein
MYVQSGESGRTKAGQENQRSYGSMTDERRRKKRSEKLSDSFVARLAREIGPSDRLGAIAGRANTADRQRDRSALASMKPTSGHSFTRCPHCREYVPIRESCRACGTPMET